MIETHKLLKKFFIKKKSSTQGYSLSKLASELDISVSFLSRILNGQKPIPFRLLIKICSRLDIDSPTVTALREASSVTIEEGVVPRKGKAFARTGLETWELASANDFSILRQWFYIPILELVGLRDFDGSTKSVAERLGLSETVADIAIRELMQKGLLTEKNGKISKTKRKLHWGSGTSLSEIRTFHRQMLLKAQKELDTALSDDDFSRRLIMGITITASSEDIERAKRKLSDCLHEIANDLTENDGNEVYHLSGQLFPLTKKLESK